MEHTKTIAIDFDGVIHKYSKGWQDGSCYDEPIEGAISRIKNLMDNGYAVFILSTRNPRQIEKWFEDIFIKHLYLQPLFKTEVINFWTNGFSKFWKKKGVLGITNKKLPAVCYIDDRALKFEGDWGKTYKDILKFKTYQGKTR